MRSDQVYQHVQSLQGFDVAGCTSALAKHSTDVISWLLLALLHAVTASLQSYCLCCLAPASGHGRLQSTGAKCGA